MAEKPVADTQSCWQPGDLILKTRPLVAVVKRGHEETRCDACLEWQEKPLRCSACQQIYYCSKQCQRTEWPSHKLECSVMKILSMPSLEGFVKDPIEFVKSNSITLVSDQGRLLLKLIVLVMKTNSCLSQIRDEAGLRSLKDLPALQAKIRRRHSWVAEYKDYRNHLHKVFNEKQVLTPKDELLWFLWCVLKVNVLPLQCISATSLADAGVSSAIALFTSLSGFKLSCEPSADYYFYKGRLMVKTVVKTKRASPSDTSNITLMFESPLLPVELRQSHYRQQFFKDCECSRCCVEANAPYLVRCSTGGCNGICRLNKVTKKCTRCDECGGKPHSLIKNLSEVFACRLNLLHSFDRPECHVKFPKEPTFSMVQEHNPYHTLDIVNMGHYSHLSALLLQHKSSEYRQLGVEILKKIVIPGYEHHAPWKFISLGLQYLNLAKNLDPCSAESFREVYSAICSAKKCFEVILDPGSGPMRHVNEWLKRYEVAISQMLL